MAERHRAGTRVVSALVAVACVLGAVACGDDGEGGTADAASDAVGYDRTPEPEVADLEFVDFAEDPAGVPYRAVAPDGGFLLFYFGYLSCPDVCPLTLGEVARARESLPADLADRTSAAMVTFDPERDEGAEVADYMANFFEPGEYHALQAAGADQLALAGERFSATWRRDEERPDGTYFMSHSAQVYVIDDTGRVTWEFPFGTDPSDMAAVLEGFAADRA
jgi:protein SCO1/2